MKRNEPVSHIMTPNPYTLQQGQSASTVRHMFAEYPIHHIPVVDGKKLVGMISMADLLGRSWGASDGRSLDALLDATTSVSDLMTTSPVTIRANTSIRDTAALLARGNFHGMPVVDEDDGVVGIVTTTDLMKFLLEQY